MSMALALEFARDWLIEKNGWDVHKCGVHFDAIPPLEASSAAPFYISIDDAGVETGNELTDSLKEILSITIGIWRRPEHLSPDRRGIMKLPSDLYLAGTVTLNDLERLVIVHKSASGAVKNGLHRNYQFVSALNSRYNLPDAALGDAYKFPFIYRGRGRMETIGLDGSSDITLWYGYRLNFRGACREQKLRDATDCIG